MKCKFCGADFKFNPNQKFCSKECCDKFHAKRNKKYRYCIVCGKALNFKNAIKYCSKECEAVKKQNDRIQKKLKLENKRLREEAKNMKQVFLYSKDFNSNIEICLNCTKDVCKGECELINSYIRG